MKRTSIKRVSMSCLLMKRTLMSCLSMKRTPVSCLLMMNKQMKFTSGEVRNGIPKISGFLILMILEAFLLQMMKGR